MGRPTKSLAQLVRDGTFRARRESHRALLYGAELAWPAFAELQRQFQGAASEPERRAIALAFEHAVAGAQQQARAEQARKQGRSLADELALLGEPGSLEQIVGFFKAYLAHPQGAMRGKPFELERWQRQFVREFYRRDSDGNRVYRRGLLALPRGNGKTAFAAGLALYELVTRLDAPEVYFAAGSKEQAGIGLKFASAFVQEGALADWVTVRRGLYCAQTKGTLQVVSSEGALQHGRAPAAAILDELWAFETKNQEEAYTALSSALHKRDNAYLLCISTAGHDKNTLLGRFYDQALAWPEVQRKRGGCLTIAKDEPNGQLFWWYGVPQDAEIEDKRLWRQANPASFVKLRELEQQRHDPGCGEPGFRRLRLNQWTAARDSWLPIDLWKTLAQPQLRIRTGAAVYVGVDVGLRHDTTAVCWAHRRDDGLIILRAKVWSANPKAAAHVELDDQVELARVEAHILLLAKKFKVKEVAYDPRFFHRSAELLETKKLTTVEFLPTSSPLADASQRFYQLAVARQLAHNGDPVLAAHIAATAAQPYDRGWKISKHKSSAVIDATVAAVMAVARADINGGHKPRVGLWLMNADGTPLKEEPE